MKAVSIRQPYAALVMAGLKTIETRGDHAKPALWNVDYHGVVLIHVSKTSTTAEHKTAYEEPLIRSLLKGLGYRNLKEMPRGVILGTATFSGVGSTKQYVDEEGFVDVSAGDVNIAASWWDCPYFFTVREPRTWARPVKWRGQQGLWEIDDDVVRKLAPEAEELFPQAAVVA